MSYLDIIFQLLPPLLRRFGPQMLVPFAREIWSLDDFPELYVVAAQEASNISNRQIWVPFNILIIVKAALVIKQRSYFSVEILKFTVSSQHKMFPLVEQDFNSEELQIREQDTHTEDSFFSHY